MAYSNAYNCVQVIRPESGERCSIVLTMVNDRKDIHFVCYVHGFDNAVRVANSISHNQFEWVSYNPIEEKKS